MEWDVEFTDEFGAWWNSLNIDEQEEVNAKVELLEEHGPTLPRPHSDVIVTSKHANMKELRFTAHGGREVWRAAFAFDPDRSAIVLVAGDKQGKNQKLFYKWLIKIADRRFDSHLKRLAAEKITKR